GVRGCGLVGCNGRVLNGWIFGRIIDVVYMGIHPVNEGVYRSMCPTFSNECRICGKRTRGIAAWFEWMKLFGAFYGRDRHVADMKNLSCRVRSAAFA
ncbi:hypothetical protein U0E23_26845, partial [Burkholderia stagnalis]|uniref:hypothetical protein n=1 Tax=Burkholderia stagnalis TaxID=1503054 RepID=UPI002AB3AE0E